MRKLKLTIAYDGTDFSGFQRQPGLRTIQGELEKALTTLTGENTHLHGSGRTDAGVHAYGQVCHFETASPIPLEKYGYILRRMLPRDIVVRSVEAVSPEFDARKSAHWKTYRYQIETSPIPDVIHRRFRTHYPTEVDLHKIEEAAKALIGTHDFTSFCSVRTHVEDKVRTIYDLQIHKDVQGVLTFWVTGSGFLYNMVRIIVGTLFEVGRGKYSPDEMEKMLQARDRQVAGPTFPPEGLMLWQVGYHPWKASFS
jgi:tRNA pseudouridine38-40 synthase